MKLEFESNTASLPLIDFQDVNEIVSNSDSPEVTRMLREGIQAAQDGRRAEARTMLLRVTEADGNNENAWLWLASISEYPEELLVFLKNVLNINPNNERAVEWAKATESLMSKTFVQRGIDASKNEQPDFARQCFLQAIVHDGKSELAWLWLASVSDSNEEKISHLQKVLSINPNNENAAVSLKSAKMHIAKSLMPKANQAAIAGKREESLKLLDEILHDAPDFEDGWMLKAHLAESFEEKIAYFEQVLEVNENNQLAKANLESLKSILNESSQDESNQSEDLESLELEVENSDAEVEEISAEVDEEIEESAEMQAVEESFESSEEEYEEAFESAEMSEVEAEHQAESFEYQEESEEVYQEESEEVEEYQVESVENTYEESFQAEENSVEDEAEFENDSSDLYFEEVSESYETQAYTTEELEAEHEEMSVSFEQDTQEFTYSEEAQAEVGEVQAESEQVYSWEKAEEAESVEAKADAYDAEEFAEVYEQQDFESEEAEDEAFESNEQVEESEHFEEEAEQHSAASFNSKHFEKVACPYCENENEHQAFACESCQAVLSLSDIEMLLTQDKVDVEMLEAALAKYEADKDSQEVTPEDLKVLGIGYLNAKKYRKGMNYLQAAFSRSPNNAVMSSQIDALTLRIAEIEEMEKEHESRPTARKILVVDDSPTVRKLISGKLEKCGHEVICAVDGMDALSKVNEHVPDLVLLDITMPRMDGYQVCKLLRGNDATKDVPVVMISGKDGFFDKVRGKMAGTTNYITKPFGPETLMKTINEYIG